MEDLKTGKRRIFTNLPNPYKHLFIVFMHIFFQGFVVLLFYLEIKKLYKIASFYYRRVMSKLSKVSNIAYVTYT